ncbi:phospholipase D-like domain-containing protein DpdK [Dictyobacter kobayashii]|uniref:Phospholipase D-like domain-containing protein n=1 Tax=Dictyobacter kobayashii TaxID=2014872 RepID=A0A402AVW2_9CHLR|nr:phospholipase D-like domain-containing protein DpdK [Dictyobacter kobayashii]GCE23219.1 hypothetical protein KDK_70190 [Dictyobacter kobayashii]
MSNRRITSHARGGSVQLTNCLHSLFALELLSPSPEIYLISPWISNVPLMNNRFGQFRILVGDTEEGELRLATVLSILADRGSKVRIIYRPHPQTEEFLSVLPSTIEYRKSMTLHAKGLITKHCYLRGSMNFTYSGVNLNDEEIELTTNLTDVSYALIEAQQRWEGLAQ